jgi:hypothetical protein
MPALNTLHPIGAAIVGQEDQDRVAIQTFLGQRGARNAAEFGRRAFDRREEERRIGG